MTRFKEMPANLDEKRYLPTYSRLVEHIGKVEISGEAPDSLRNWLFNESAAHTVKIEGEWV